MMKVVVLIGDAVMVVLMIMMAGHEITADQRSAGNCF
jgi:hypothetical protein